MKTQEHIAFLYISSLKAVHVFLVILVPDDE